MLELNKIYCGNCLDVMKSIPDGSIDAIITDPPYGTTACKRDTVIPFEPMWEQLKRIIKPNGVIVLFGSQPFTSLLVTSNLNMFKYQIYWNKIKPSNYMSAKRQPLKIIEDILVFGGKNYYPVLGVKTGNTEYHKKFYDENIKKNNNSSYGNRTRMIVKYSSDYDYSKKYPTNLISFTIRDTWSKIKKRLHPTQKPVALMEYLIKTYTNEGETVLDFTCGSGSTLVGCKKLNRNFVGIEMSQEYVDIANKRLLDMTNKQNDQPPKTKNL